VRKFLIFRESGDRFPRLVPRVPPLRDHALQDLPESRREDVGGGAMERRRHPPRPTGETELVEDHSALVVRQVQRRAASDVQDIKHEVGDRDPLGQLADGGLPADVHPLLQQSEVGRAPLVERHQLAVQHYWVSQLGGEGRNLGVAGADVAVVVGTDREQ
jgi:hypothetical protein